MALELCFYCGENIADGRDHITPVLYRKTHETVPACGPCNSILGNKLFDSADAKREYVQGRLRRREMSCEHCGAFFTPKHPRGRYCSAKCRKAAWQAKRGQREARLRGLVKVLAKEAGLTAEDFA
mgnify:CR=1 FL=1